ncbi:MAG: hypothetical protein L3J92_03635 [Thermoplasmata archaeon]|jgi:hypothetical protein|nr:hypothetical protein [Thermoplasmata archaeon]
MHSYIDLYFSPDGVSPLDIADRLRATAGLSFLVGNHDLAFEWDTVEQFRATLSKIHEALRGSGVSYRVETVAEESAFVDPIAWPPLLPRSPSTHPGF